MILSRLSISAKILIVIGVLAMASVTTAGIGYMTMRSLASATHDVDLAATEIRLGTRIAQNALELRRAEYWMALDPGDIGQVIPIVEDAVAELEDRLERAEATATGNQRAMVAEVRAAYDAYRPELDRIVALARRAGSVEMTAAQQQLYDAVRGNSAEVENLRTAISAFVDYTDQRTEQVVEAAEETAATGTLVTLLVAAIGVVLGVGLGLFVSQVGITRPFRAIVDCLRRLADGDLEVEVVGEGRRDELGTLAATMVVFKDNMLRNRQMEEEAAAAEARAEEQRKAEMNRLADEFEESVTEIVNSVSTAATELEGGAQSLSTIAEETSSQAVTVAGASEQALANIETVAASAEEFTASINEINRQISDSSQQAREASGELEKTNEAVDHLRQTVEKIGDVVEMIQDIAAQTNLLALNATIEAARAGEAGKGFAVVASEVKTLAEQTSKATEDISRQIEEVQQSSLASIEAVGRIGTVIEAINASSAAVSAAVEEQATATSEVARNMREAATGTRTVNENITGVTEASTETGRMSGDVLTASGELAQQSAALRNAVEAFIARVRAA
jgi:methyl-accepting chemotaxis protein